MLLPVLTRYLSPSDYGIVAMYQVLVGIIGSFTGVSVHGAVVRRFYDRDTIDFPGYVFNCVMILCTSSALVAVLLWTFAPLISRYTEFPATWLGVVLLASMAEFMVLLTLSIWQAESKPRKYAAFQIAQTFVNMSLSILLVVGLRWGWQGRVCAQVIASGSFAVMGLMLLRRAGYLKWGIRRDYIRHALAFGLPLVPHSIGMYCITITDRVLLTNLRGVAETGIYVVGAQVGMFIWLMQDAFNRAWVPWFYAQLKMDNQERRLRIVRITYLYDFLIVGVSLAFAFIAAWALQVFVGRAFVHAGQFLPWVCLGYAFNGMYKMVTNYCFYVERTAVLAWITFGTAVVNALACYLLIVRNGAVGAAQGTMAAYLLSFLGTWVVASRLYPMPWNLRKATVTVTIV